MRFTKKLLRMISILLIALQLMSCIQYRTVKVDKHEKRSFEGHILHIVYPYYNESNYYMTDATLKDDSLSGRMSKITNYKPYNQKDFLVDIHMKNTEVKPDSLPRIVDLPLSSIEKIEIYKYDPGMSLVTTVLVSGLTVAAVLFAIMLIILATKESCPFVYTFDGENYNLTGEIYSGAILPSLERDDYLPLPDLKPINNQYQLKMDNQMQEIQSTNLAKLLVIDHPKDSKVLVDKYGVCHTYQNLQQPISASSKLQDDILSLVSESDDLMFPGDADAGEDKTKDEMYFSFNRPEGVDNAKLVIRAKNSFWLDYTMGQFFSLFGDKYSRWFAKQKDSDKAIQPNWALEQGIPMSVYLKQNNEWKFVDYYHVVGPMAEKEMIMPIDLSGINSNEIELKLECGFMFWETDFIGMDFTPDQKVFMEEVALTSAIDHNGEDVARLLNTSDDEYFVMPEIGNQAIMTYAVPQQREGYNRSAFLHSRGHYEVIRNPSGKTDVSYLETFRKPGRLSVFSRERYLHMREQFSR
ncbi:MAG: hypothetical protein JXR56_01075 [Candidatus Cloacimonetes bacterium]|nr:hypothetical protein [Candidatus Cloacimonadota bacterium]